MKEAIEIVTVFLGLYGGAQAVEVRAGETVAAIELRLDGETVETRAQPPWVFQIDLGTELAPHRLTAIGYGPGGAEIGRSRRWIHRGGVPDGVGDPIAVAVLLDGRRELPPPPEMDGWFLGADGETLEVVRAERGEATVVVVLDAAADSFLDYTAGMHSVSVSSRRRRRQDDFLRLEDGVGFRFLSPRAPPASRIRSPQEIFVSTQPVEAGSDGLLWHVASTRPLRFRQRISDAVAMAALEAHASRERRLVWLVTETATAASGRYRRDQVRRLLTDLQVPLVVWAFRSGEPRRSPEPAGEPWAPTRILELPEAIHEGTVAAYLRQLDHWFRRDLGRTLGRQRMVWLRGDLMPHRVRLSEAADGIRLAGAAEE